MAQAIRAIPGITAAPIGVGRTAAGPRAVATVDGMPVEQLSGGFAAANDDAGLFLQGSGSGAERRVPARPSTLGEGPIYPSSESFVAALEAQYVASGPAGSVAGAGATYDGVPARAIGVYETNARVVNGTLEARGGSVNRHL